MKKLFRIGETVMLKSGGPQMTVAEMFPAKGMVEVLWMSAMEKSIQSARLPEAVLKAMEVKKTTRTITSRELVTKTR